MPVDRWSTSQVLALAPDEGSVKGARGVSGAGHWEALGLVDDVVWGLCKGSGKNPYQVCVDLSGPAYRCSCPSRKFPCKHALGLLLRWADGGGGAGDEPDWVAEWRQGRAARAAKAAAPRGAEGPTDPEAARRRAGQRTDRITAGLAELQRWLDDQVHQGLAAAEHAGHDPFAAMAARLVDAQAPTVAGTVRRLGGTAGVGPHWADRLLGELALLRLLVTAHARLDALPADLAATVRARVGYPVTNQEVLATAPVRDRWQVLGQVDAVDEKLTTRRTWLRGVDTGRFALLLAFAAPGQALPADVVPGTEVDADLCFYPGALPLRALVAVRHGPPRPLETPHGGDGVEAALAAWTAALAADPWRETVPVVLAGVVPSDDGHLVDQAGDGVPLAPGHQQPWWLLAAAGGQPAGVAGELGPDGLRPLAAWHQGGYLPAAPGAPGGGRRGPELPAGLLSAALVGTARRPGADPAVEVGGRRLTVGAGSTAGALLEAAAVALTYRRAGAPPVSGRQPVPAAPEESRRVVGPAAAARLQLLLTKGATPGDADDQQAMLRQWLQAAARRGVLAPPPALPALLDAGRRSTALRPLLAEVAGRRGRWLAGRHPEWRYLLDEATADTAPAGDAWQTGSAGERLADLLRLRRSDPAAGLALLQATFDQESPADRARFVEALATGLSPADEEFLERVLGDRRKEVRQAAVDLLRRLPGSALGRRMADRATTHVRLQPRGFGRDRLLVTLPEKCDAAMRRDGVDTRAPRHVGPGAWLLEEIIAGTPLDTWTAAFDRPPAAVVALPVDHAGDALRRGWARAAVAQGDAEWATALAGRDDALVWHLHPVLPAEHLERFAAAVLRRDPDQAPRVLGLFPDGWPAEVADGVVDLLTRGRGGASWRHAELCRAAVTAMPAHYAARVARLVDAAAGSDGTHADASWQHAVAELAAALTFRLEMHKELT